MRGEGCEYPYLNLTPTHLNLTPTLGAADLQAPVRHNTDMALVLRLGEAAASGMKRGYSLLWQPRERSLSFMPQSRTDGGRVRSDLAPGYASDARSRVRNARATIVQQLRDLRADPSGGANGGQPPDLTVMLVGTVEAG